MRSYKLIVVLLLVSLVGFTSQLVMAQEAWKTDELATIACREEVVGLRLTGGPVPQELRALAAQEESRIAAANVVSQRLLEAMALPERRPLRAQLEAFAAASGAHRPECRRMVEEALKIAYADDPLSGILRGDFTPWEGGIVRLAAPGAKHEVTVPAAPAGVAQVFLWCLALPAADGGAGAGTVDVNGVRVMTCPPARTVGAAVRAGQKLTIAATAANSCFVWVFAEGGRFATGFGGEIFPSRICAPPPRAASTPLLRIFSSPGVVGLRAALDAAREFEHRKALTRALSENVRAVFLGRSLDVIRKELEECVTLGTAIPPVLGVSIPCDAPGRAAILEEDLTGFYGIHAGNKLVFAKPDPDKPTVTVVEEVCKVLLDTATGKRLVGGKTSPELRWAAANAFMAPTSDRGGVGSVRFRLEGQVEFVALCPEILLSPTLDEKEKFIFAGRAIGRFQDNKRDFLALDKRIPFALRGESAELRAVAAAALARPLANLTLTELLRKLDGLVDQERLVRLLAELKSPCETNPARAGECKRERVLQELALAASSRDIRQAAGWALGLLLEEWLRTGERSTIIDLRRDPRVEAREGCRLPYGAFCHALANNAPGSTINWPEAASAAVTPLTRHFAGPGTILLFFKMPIIGFQVTLAFSLGNVP